MRYELRAVRDDDFGHDLYRIENDGAEVYLGTDVMAPEDVNFWRDLSWVPDELERLAMLLQQQRALNADVAIQLEKYAYTVAANHPVVRRKLEKQARRLRGGGSAEQP